MKITTHETGGNNVCRLCDKRIGKGVKNIRLELNTLEKLFFHIKCWKKFRQTITESTIHLAVKE